DDHSLCDYLTEDGKVRPGLDPDNSAGVGAVQPNIRRVYRNIGTGSDSRKVLVCREVDTNLDGTKDVVRRYTDEGQSKDEEADSNYDGKIDTWNIFLRGRLSEVRLDRNFDGNADEKKFYGEGKLIRVERDNDFNGKTDIWEMYRTGRLERIGVDLDGDGRVDRWDRDVEWLKQLGKEVQKRQEDEAKRREEEAAKRVKEAEEAATKAGATDGQPTPASTATKPIETPPSRAPTKPK
ncbi:MAG: hypothetical protein FJ096_22545, partial [Deltaproteobacteria bacterium]|nr:hypothetical protein [Deltaproteobacteria bacterium]